MTDNAEYTPPAVWTWANDNGGRFANINRPTAGAQSEKDLPLGEHPQQLYSLGTPNGVKVTIMLEELLELGEANAEYDAWLINIQEGAQFSSGFVGVNPNSKIPALLDRSGDKPVRVFESGAILLHLADKFGHYMPKDGDSRAEYSTPFQIDANMGLTAAVYEMLVQSRPGVIKLLPAVPAQLSSGKISGIRTRASVKVDMEWRLEPFEVKVNFVSARDQTIRVKLPKQPVITDMGDGQSLPSKWFTVELSLKAEQPTEYKWSLKSDQLIAH